MSFVSKSRARRLGLLAVVAVISSPGVASAVVPVQNPPPLLTPVLINGTAGDQNDPHVSVDWASYTSTSRSLLPVQRSPAAIPPGPSARDQLANISGSGSCSPA
jgi:hypothetical protein